MRPMLRTAAVVILSLWTAPALAQGNICRTAQPGSTAPNCASEDFATRSIAASVATMVGTVKTQVFTSTGTYTPSAGMLSAIIECMGGGGAGGGSTGSVSFLTSGGGGGAGSYARKYVSAADVTPSQSVTMGAGGAGAANAIGGNGGDTSVGALCIGKGGSGGALGTSSVFGLGGAGGVAGTGDVTLPGAAGGDGAYQNGASVGFVVPSGMGAVSQFGGGGVQTASSDTSVSNGAASSGFGGGGSGGMSNHVATNTKGGDGAPGYVVITEFCSQ